MGRRRYRDTERRGGETKTERYTDTGRRGWGDGDREI